MAREPVLYPGIYPWYVILATLDVLLTWLIISSFDGRELNPIAAGVISTGGLAGAAFYKFATVMFVMWACEYIGRRRVVVGRQLAFYAMMANFVPVSLSVAQLVVARGPM